MTPARTGIRVEQAAREQAELNQRFRSGNLVDQRFYTQLSEQGCDVKECVLVKLVPDGAETYFGAIIRQDGRVFDFDLALRDASSSEWEDRTERFLDAFEKEQRSKPWTPTVVAYRMFMGERKAGSHSS